MSMSKWRFWPEKKFFVGIMNLEVAGARFLHPPMKLDWQGSVGPFKTESEARQFVDIAKARENQHEDK